MTPFGIIQALSRIVQCQNRNDIRDCLNESASPNQARCVSVRHILDIDGAISQGSYDVVIAYRVSRKALI